MTPTIGKIVNFSAGGKEYRLRFNNRAWMALGIDPYKANGKDLQDFISTLDMTKVNKFVWAGMLWENKALKFEEVEEELLDNMEPSAWVSFMQSFNSTYNANAAGGVPVETSEPEGTPPN